MTTNTPDPAEVAAELERARAVPNSYAHVLQIANEKTTELNELREAFVEQTAELERLQAIVDKFPKTIDGVVLLPSMDVYVRYETGIEIRENKGYWDREVYSTRAAAEAAEKIVDSG